MEILTRALKQAHREAGLSLEEDEDFLYLKRGARTLATFLASTNLEPVLAEADKYIGVKYARF